LLTDRAGQAPRVDADDADPAGLFQPADKIAGGAPVRRLGRVPFHHHAISHRIGGFVIFGGDAGVADMGKRKGYDLPGIGRVGHDFLVAGHRGVETQLGHAGAGGTEARAEKQGSVGKRKACGRRGGHGGRVPWICG
jgi:hypothetical protein